MNDVRVFDLGWAMARVCSSNDGISPTRVSATIVHPSYTNSDTGTYVPAQSIELADRFRIREFAKALIEATEENVSIAPAGRTGLKPREEATAND